MTLPAIPKVIIRFGGGAVFANVLVLGSATDGILGTNILGDYDNVEVPSVQAASIRRGRSDLDQQFGAGVASVTFLDDNGDWNPQNASSPYFGELVPGRQLQIQAVDGGVGYNLFSGYITSYDLTYDIGSPVARVTVEAVDALRLFQLASISTISGSSAGDLPGTRLAQILNSLSWPTTARALDDGSVTLQDDPGSDRTMLTAMRTVEDSELGALFIDASGNVTFLDRQNIAQRAVASPTVFSDQGTDLPYTSVDFTFDDVEIINDVTVEREGGTAQTASDATSIDSYFRRSSSRTGLLMETDDRALQQANMIVASRKDPKLRLRSISFDVVDAARLAAALDLDFADPVQVVREHVAGSTITLTSTVQGVNHDITPDRWVTSLSTAEALAYAFVLGSSQYGVLGENVL